jgi:hypothetical protein
VLLNLGARSLNLKTAAKIFSDSKRIPMFENIAVPIKIAFSKEKATARSIREWLFD